MYLKSEKDLELCEFKRKVSLNKNEKPLHGAGIEPATPAVLRQCHNQLDHPRQDICQPYESTQEHFYLSLKSTRVAQSFISSTSRMK